MKFPGRLQVQSCQSYREKQHSFSAIKKKRENCMQNWFLKFSIIQCQNTENVICIKKALFLGGEKKASMLYTSQRNITYKTL